MKPEDRLLKAIFGEQKVPKDVCAKCNKTVLNPIYLNGNPYHARCASTLFEEK